MHVTGTNPTTGETKEIEVYAGQRISTYLYNDRNVDSIMFFVEDITERDLPEFVLERLRENPALLEKACKETGWDKPWILGIVTPTPTPTPPPTEEKSPDTSSEEDMTPPSDEELLPEKTEDGVLTKEELAWAHSHIMFIDPSTGIFALKDTTLFDPVFYAASNPDVVAKYGTDPDALLWHYLQRGKKEGRPPIAPPTPTPTPTPVWEEPKTESHEEEPEPTPVAKSQTQTNYSSLSSTMLTGSLSEQQNVSMSAANGTYHINQNDDIEVDSGNVAFEDGFQFTNLTTGTTNTISLSATNTHLKIPNGGSGVASIVRRIGGNTDLVGSLDKNGFSYHYADDSVNYAAMEDPTVAPHQGWYRLAGGGSGSDVYIRETDGYVTTTAP